ncbi:EAL domain-containing protein [Enterobacter kobei]|uniref:EAL domain-containing protein n=1 Tax=Enterobacter kobei TaxID=208224 RepID=UPI002A82937A|nr:EAL domain-containing protein [Enterobacter kobei]
MKMSKSALAVCILAPALLVTLLSSGMAVLQLKRDTAITADVLIGQIDHVTTIALNATNSTVKLASQPCESIFQKLAETAAFTPYIRSTGLIRNDILVCSSVTGARQYNATEVYGFPISAPKGSFKIIATEGTSSVPGHEAIIYAFRADSNVTAFSVVDARYFTDLMLSLDDENHAMLQLQFSDGPVITSQGNIYPHKAGFHTEFRSDNSQARLQIKTPLLALNHYILRNMIFLGPLSLLLTLVMLYLCRRWQARKMSLADEIRKGMADGEFSIHYQPVCETSSGNCSGAEALLRWQRDDGRTISPAVFICAAEEEGLIISLTQHLFGLIASDVSNWEVSAPFHLGVNIAADHIMDGSFTTDILQLRMLLDASFCLVLEITERSLVEDSSTASAKMEELRQKGCQVAVDDFGTGYCSLSLLQKLPVDYLKIDKSFIDALTSAGEDTPILDAIVGLSKRLGFTTIAEGVSTQPQVEWLTKNQVPYVQGYHYARPMSASDFYQWYEANRARSGVSVT